MSLPAVPTDLSRLEILATPVHLEGLVSLVGPPVPSVLLCLPLLDVLAHLDGQVDLESQVHLRDPVHLWDLVVQQLLAPRPAHLDRALPAIKIIFYLSLFLRGEHVTVHLLSSFFIFPIQLIISICEVPKIFWDI